jgi:hypothetical protein
MVVQRACFGCGSTEHILRDCPKNPAKVQQVVQESPEEILFIGNVKGDYKSMPMKVKTPTKVHNRFRVLQVDEEDDEEETHVFAVKAEEQEPAGEVFERKGPGMKVKYTPGGKAMPSTHKNMMEGMEGVSFVQAVLRESGLVDLGVGDIIIDSAADESCWPVGQGDAYPTKVSKRQLKLRTANGGEMMHYGEKEVVIKYKGGETKDPVGLKFQVTDVRKPLLAVRRLVERGNIVVLSGVEGESYILNKEAKVKIPVVKKGGSFVVEAQFVQGFAGQA